MRAVFYAISFGALLSGCKPDVPEAAPVAQDHKSFHGKYATNAEELFGVWHGYWNDVWSVTLTVSKDPDTGGYSVLYEWEERVGQPLQSVRLPSEFRDGIITNDWLDLQLSGDAPNEAHARGKFGDNPRTAKLKRVAQAPQ